MRTLLTIVVALGFASVAAAEVPRSGARPPARPPATRPPARPPAAPPARTAPKPSPKASSAASAAAAANQRRMLEEQQRTMRNQQGSTPKR